MNNPLTLDIVSAEWYNIKSQKNYRDSKEKSQAYD